MNNIFKFIEKRCGGDLLKKKVTPVKAFKKTKTNPSEKVRVRKNGAPFFRERVYDD